MVPLQPGGIDQLMTSQRETELGSERAHSTAPIERRLDWEGCLNARDLGGYPVANGQQTRWGAFIRADSLSYLSEAGKAALVAYGVHTVIDLRLPVELESEPNPFAEGGDRGILYRHISMVDPSNIPNISPPRLADEYKRMLATYGDGVAEVMTGVAEAPAGGVLYHCAGGRDRTGLVSAFLLDLAGVPREVIGEDYGISSDYLKTRTVAWVESDPALREKRAEEMDRLWTRPEVILEVLDDLDEKYGGVAAYLRHIGISDPDISQMRERLLPTT